MIRSANETVITYNVTEFGDFSASRKTVFVLHGFSDDKEGWVNDIKDKLLEKVGGLDRCNTSSNLHFDMMCERL